MTDRAVDGTGGNPLYTGVVYRFHDITQGLDSIDFTSQALYCCCFQDREKKHWYASHFCHKLQLK